jgi:hypothetical protein
MAVLVLTRYTKGNWAVNRTDKRKIEPPKLYIEGQVKHSEKERLKLYLWSRVLLRNLIVA